MSAIVPRNKVLSPLVIVLTAWLLPLAVLASGLVQYEGVDYEPSTMFYLAGALVLFALGFRSATHTRKPPYDFRAAVRITTAERWAQDVQRHSKLISFFATCGILAAILFSIEMLFIVGISPADFLATRDAFATRDATVFSQVAAVIGAGGYFSLVSVILCWDSLSRSRRIFWLLSPILLSVFSLFSAGRQTIFQLALISFFSLWLRGGFGRRLRSIGGRFAFGLFIVLAVGYGILISSLRSGTQVQGLKMEELSVGFHAYLQPEFVTTLNSLPSVLRDGIAEGIFYFTHPIPNFTIFFAQPRPGPYWGLWELPFLARRIESTGIIDTSVSMRIDDVYSQFATSGRAPQIWLTAFRDLTIDFGDLGSLIVTLIFGYVVGRVYFRMRTEGRLITAYLFIGLQLVCAYSSILSVVSDTLVFIYLLTATILYRIIRPQKDFL